MSSRTHAATLCNTAFLERMLSAPNSSSSVAPVRGQSGFARSRSSSSTLAVARRRGQQGHAETRFDAAGSDAESLLIIRVGLQVVLLGEVLVPHALQADAALTRVEFTFQGDGR